MRELLFRYASVLVALFCLIQPLGSAHADEAPQASQNELIRLSAGDSVKIEVYGQPDMSTTVYVGDDGTISVPLAGPVRVADLTPVQAATRVDQALKDGGILVNPHVTIILVQSTRRITILGEVHQPGRYVIDPHASIFDIIAQAGGLTDNSADVGYIIRRDTSGNANRYPVNLKNLSAQAETASVRLQSGDELYVPHAAQFYIYGEVNAPGMYRIEPAMTIIQAVARAGGVTPRGSARRIEVKRMTAKGTTVIHVGPDTLVQPDDVIQVKQSIF